jgi:predicted dehydrogenase/RimJ/RimL family protein N-acetyltransferase
MALKILIAGCGSIGARHAGNAAKRADVAAIDPDRARAEAVAAATKAKVFPDVAAALAWKPDAAIIATPPKYHLGIADQLVSVGIPVLIEKPISLSLDGVDALIGKAAKKGVPLHVACNMRFHLGPAALKSALPGIGKPLFASAHYGNYLPAMRPDVDYRTLYAARRAEGGGVIFDAIHEIDYLGWLFGPAASVTCVADRFGGLDIDVEDHAIINLSHASGVHSNVQLDYLRRRKSRGCEIVGSEGTLTWHSDGKAPERVRVERAGPDGKVTLLAGDDAYDANTMYVAMLDAFLDAVAGKPAPDLQTGEQARTALAAACAAHDSAKDRLSHRDIWSPALATPARKAPVNQGRMNGDAIYLRPLVHDDVNETYLRWLTDPEVGRFLETRHRRQTLDTIHEFVGRVNARDDEFLFGIFLKDNDRHVGNIKVGPVKENHSLADVSLFIGERDCWGRGIATDAIRVVSRFAFEALGVNKLNASAYAENRGSIGAFLRVGYTQEGVRKRHLFLDGEPADVIEVGLCAEDLKV